MARDANGDAAEVFANPLPAGILMADLVCSCPVFPSGSMVAFASDVAEQAVSAVVLSSTLLRFDFGLSSDLVKLSVSIEVTVEVDGTEG